MAKYVLPNYGDNFAHIVDREYLEESPAGTMCTVYRTVCGKEIEGFGMGSCPSPTPIEEDDQSIGVLVCPRCSKMSPQY